MLYKKIGDTQVPAIGQGTGGIHNSAIIRAAIDAGLNLIDTAESYGNEEIIGEAIRGRRQEIFISTKFSPEHNGYEDVIKSCESSLKRLGTDYLDLYSAHYRNPNIPEDQTQDALDKLITDGKVRFAGICNTYRPMLNGFDLKAVQVEYNLFDRTAEKELLPYCAENNIAILAYSPLRYMYQLNPDKMILLREFCPQKTLAQIALNWIISHNPVIALTSSSKLDHIKKNAASCDFTLTEGEFKAIDNLFQSEIMTMPVEMIDITLSADRFPQTEDKARTCQSWSVKPQDIDLRDYKAVKIGRCAYDDASRFPQATYEVKEGGLRYWAWRIQKHGESIPVIIEHRWKLDFKGEV